MSSHRGWRRPRSSSTARSTAARTSFDDGRVAPHAARTSRRDPRRGRGRDPARDREARDPRLSLHGQGDLRRDRVRPLRGAERVRVRGRGRARHARRGAQVDVPADAAARRWTRDPEPAHAGTGGRGGRASAVERPDLHRVRTGRRRARGGLLDRGQAVGGEPVLVRGARADPARGGRARRRVQRRARTGRDGRRAAS